MWNPYIEWLRKSSPVPAFDAKIADLDNPDSLPADVRDFVREISLSPRSLSIESLTRGVRFALQRGNTARAWALAHAALKETNVGAQAPAASWLRFVLGALLLQHGERRRARAAFRGLDDERLAREDAFFPPEVHRAFYESIAFNNDKIAAIQHVDTWLGRCDDPAAAQRADREIEAFLEDVFARAESGEDLWQPEAAFQTEASCPPEALPEKPRVLLLESTRLTGTPCDGPRPAFSGFTLLRDAAEGNVELLVHPGDTLPHGGSMEKIPPDQAVRRIEEGLARLEEAIQTFKPHMLLADVSFEPKEGTLQPRHLSSLREKLPVAGLLWNEEPGHAFRKHWEMAVDSFAVPDLFTLSRIGAPDAWEKAVGLFPIALASGESPAKTTDFVHAGTPQNYCHVWLTWMQFSGLSCRFLARQGSQEGACADDEDMDCLQHGKITFNSGYCRPNVTTLTARPFEAIRARCLLMEEEGSPLGRFFRPYVHYIPVRTVHELVHFSRFFCRHEDWRRRVADGACDYAMKHYPASSFWRRLLGTTLRPDRLLLRNLS